MPSSRRTFQLHTIELSIVIFKDYKFFVRYKCTLLSPQLLFDTGLEKLGSIQLHHLDYPYHRFFPSLWFAAYAWSCGEAEYHVMCCNKKFCKFCFSLGSQPALSSKIITMLSTYPLTWLHYLHQTLKHWHKTSHSKMMMLSELSTSLLTLATKLSKTSYS